MWLSVKIWLTVLRLRSWTSSKTITLYLESTGSTNISLSKQPSVMYFTTVSWLTHSQISRLLRFKEDHLLLGKGWLVFASHLWCAVIKAHLVANLSTQMALHLLCYSLGHCDSSHSARLGDADFAIFTETYTEWSRCGRNTVKGPYRYQKYITFLYQLGNITITATCLKKVLWKLCGFPASSLTDDNQEGATFDSLN